MTDESHRPRRQRIAPWLSAAAALVVGGIYHEALLQWFTGDAGPSAATPVHVHGSSAHGDHGATPEIAYYTCSMHPSVRKPGPGNCPICGMVLTPVLKDTTGKGGVIIDTAQRKRVGIETSTVRKAPMSLSVRALGRVTYDESKLVDVTLRVGGFIRQLRVNETGQPVKKGAPLLTLYSPELYSAQQEYLLARQGVGTNVVLPGRDALAHAARKRLLLLGMLEPQIAAIEKRGEPSEDVTLAAPSAGFVIEKNVVAGAAVQAGERLYRIAPLDEVWVQADVYEQDLRYVHKDQHASITLPYLPGQHFEGTVSYVYPYLAGSSRTGTVRIALRNTDLVLKAEMYADVLFELPLGERVQVPASAVVYTGTRRLLFVDRGEGRLVPTAIELGARAGDAIEVLSGVVEGEQVVTAGNFLVAAESRIRNDTGDFGGGTP
jgi:Cu(I)/Ag(I) efflux system membrane fusion protein